MSNTKKNPRRVFPPYTTRLEKKIVIIEEFLVQHDLATVGWTSRKTQQLDMLLADLRAQFGRMERAWDDMRGDVDEGPEYQEAEGRVRKLGKSQGV